MGGRLVTPLEERCTSIWIDGQLIERLADGQPAGDAGCTVLDARGCVVTPGLFDLQVNGGPEGNLWGDPTATELSALRRAMAAAGVTAFLPTLITADTAHLRKNIGFLSRQGVAADRALLRALAAGGPGALTAVGQTVARADGQARMPGIHLEGPFLSPARPGVHPPEWIKPLSAAAVEALITDDVALMTLAPEQEPDGEAVRLLIARGVRVSLGHSNADFQTARRAFDQGATLMTHTFNALPPLHHRAPGAVAAALIDPQVSCCLIPDGLHVDPAVIELVIKLKGAARTILVTDRAQIGTSQGGLVGSSMSLDQAVRNMVSWGAATFAQAIRMATWNPAAALGLERSIGHLAAGKLADLVIWDEQSLSIKQVILGGRPVWAQDRCRPGEHR